MERLGYTPATLLEDVETELPVKTGTYVPRNYDQRYHGPVRLREALGNSLNIPAVRVVERVGVEAFLERLGTLGFAHLKESPDYYGPALALGDGEVTLLELARAYATLARGGIDKPLRVVRRTAGPSGVSTPAEGRPSRVLDEKAAALLEDILMDKVAREGAFGTNSVLDLPFPVAVKTGTSKGYRDNYAVGFTKEVTVAVWVGNFDGSPMVGVSGITGAGPLFRTVMEAAMRHRTPSPMGLPATADHDAFERFDVCALSGQRPTPACPHRLQEWFPRGHGPAHDCMHHERIPVDTRNGLRALPSCPREVVEEKSFERHPGLFLPWSLAAHRPLAPQGLSPLCHGGAGSVSVEEKGPGVARILSPRNGAHFAIDPNRPRSQQALRIQVEASHRDQPVHLRVDGAWLATLTFPYQVAWPLQPGHHVLAIEMAKGNPRSSHDDRDHDRDRDETERGTPGPFVARHSIAIDVD
jgi:penicillin-binding protein 1C